jgi:hypothetical protein
VEVVNRDGGTETRSMIYTEYFVNGTQPTTVCPLHPSPSLMDRLAGLFGGGRPEAPVTPDQAGLPDRAGTSGVADRPAAAPARAPGEISGGTASDEKPKKRGFWAKVFGKKDKGEDNNRDKPEDKKKSDR